MWHWMGGGSSNSTLVQHLITTGRVASPRVADAMRAVDRGKFVAAFPGADVEHAYLVRERRGGGGAQGGERVFQLLPRTLVLEPRNHGRAALTPPPDHTGRSCGAT